MNVKTKTEVVKLIHGASSVTVVAMIGAPSDHADRGVPGYFEVSKATALSQLSCFSGHEEIVCQLIGGRLYLGCER